MPSTAEPKVLTITFRQARGAGACSDSYRTMAEHLGGVTKWGDRKPVPLTEVLEVLGLPDTLWALEEVAPIAFHAWGYDVAQRVYKSAVEGLSDEDKAIVDNALKATKKYHEEGDKRENYNAVHSAAGQLMDLIWRIEERVEPQTSQGNALEAIRRAVEGYPESAASFAQQAAKSQLREATWQKNRLLKYLKGELPKKSGTS